VYVPVGDAPPPDAPHWRARVELRFGNEVEVLGEGEGRSLRIAERNAALDALARYASAG
jgi:ribonuclease-3